eukprot:Em0008g68a
MTHEKVMHNGMRETLSELRTRMISDNTKTFKSAVRLIYKLLHPQKFCNTHLIWNYNLEKAPWWGGMFERMIRSMKMCLKKTIGGATDSDDHLRRRLT